MTFFFSQEPWDQDKFEQLLVNWMVACDQPFDEVEKPEFMAAMSYGRSPAKFTLPKRDGVRRCVMKLGEEAVEETKAMFSVRSSLLICSFAGLGKQNQSLSRHLDIKQLLCIFSNCSSLYHKRWTMW